MQRPMQGRRERNVAKDGSAGNVAFRNQGVNRNPQGKRSVAKRVSERDVQKKWTGMNQCREADPEYSA